MLEEVTKTLTSLRKTKPLVLCLTNYVTMDFMANSLLALGAAPIMSVCDDELEELVRISHAINLNIGTLDADFIARSKLVAALTREYQKPLILDPVGAGASVLRTDTAKDLMKYASIIKGNASEIMALVGDDVRTLGVESANPTQHAQHAARALAENLGCTFVVSGAQDLIVDGTRQEFLAFGSSLMPFITGMGCTLGAVIAAFRSVVPDSYAAAKVATTYFGLCGNLVHEKTGRPGSFRTAFIDELYVADFVAMRRIYDAL